MILKIECLDCGHVENQAIKDRGEADDIRQSWVGCLKLCQNCNSCAIQSGVHPHGAKMKQVKPLELIRPSRPADYGSPTGVHVPAAIAVLGLLICVALVWATLP